jgi:hypothetical protein
MSNDTAPTSKYCDRSKYSAGTITCRKCTVFCVMNRFPHSSNVNPNCAGPDALSAFHVNGSNRMSAPRNSNGSPATPGRVTRASAPLFAA